MSDTAGLSDPESYLYAKTTAVLAAQGMEGIGGWMFDIPTGEDIELDSDITDHYVESGSFTNDHVVLKPIIITLSGYKGELIYTHPKKNSAQGVLNNATSLLSTVSAYNIPLTGQAAGKLATITNTLSYAAGQIEAIKKRASNLVKYFSGDDDSENLQQKAFISLQAMWNSKQLITVQTPWGFYENMIIKSISTKQDAESNDYTDFTVTLKEMRFVSTKTTTFDSGAYTSAIDAQKTASSSPSPAGGTQLGQSVLKTEISPGAPSRDSAGNLIPGTNQAAGS